MADTSELLPGYAELFTALTAWISQYGSYNLNDAFKPQLVRSLAAHLLKRFPALSAAKPQGVDQLLGRKIRYRAGGRYPEWERGEYYFAGVTAHTHRKIGEPSFHVADCWPIEHAGNITDGFSPDEWEFVDALTPTQPSPDRLTEENACQQEVRAWEWISDIIEKNAKFWIDDANVAHVNNAPAVAHKIVTDSVTLQLLRPLISRLTTPQAPSMPTREQIARLIEKNIRLVLFEGAPCLEVPSVLDATDAILALFTPSPSPEQRGET